MPILKRIIPIFALVLFILTSWIDVVRGADPIIPWIYFSSWRTGDQELYRMRPDGSMRQRLTFIEGREEYSLINAEWIYFSKEFGPEFEGINKLYRMRTDGSHQEVILEDFSWIETTSPDNEWIYYTGASPDGQSLYRMHPNGTEQTRLTPLENVAWFQTFDAHQEWLYYTLTENYNNWALYRMHMDGSQQQKIVDIAGGNEFHGFSPDQRWLYFTAGSNNDILYRMNLEDWRQERLTPDSYYDTIPYSSDFDGILRLSADETWLYLSSVDKDENFDVYRMRLDGSAREKLTDFPEDVWLRQLSPDGQWVYFTMEVAGIQQLFGMRPDGSEIRQLTTSKTDTWLRDFSPNGEWIYFSGNDDIYRMRLDGSQQQNLTSSEGRDSLWEFSHDASWIYFTSRRTGNVHLYRMRLDGSDQEQLSPTFKGDEFWGGFSKPVNLTWHQTRLRTSALILLSIWGGVFFWQLRYKKRLAH